MKVKQLIQLLKILEEPEAKIEIYSDLFHKWEILYLSRYNMNDEDKSCNKNKIWISLGAIKE